MKKIKKKSKGKNIIPIIIILTMILLISLAILIYIYTQNYINVEYVDKESMNIKSDEVISVSPIIINNVVVGGVSDNGKWLSKDNMFGKANLTKGSEIDMYNLDGKMGTFEIYSVSHDSEKEITYAVPLKDIVGQEYVAVSKSDNNAMIRKLVKITPTDVDEKYVKKALGKYKLFNNTVKVNEVYEGYLGGDVKTRLITATSNGKNRFGVYSIVLYVQDDRCKIIKYSYVKNTKSAIDWPVYSIKFACDLNYDGNYELIIQETRELKMKYSVLEFKKDKYYEVMGIEFKI